MTENISPLLLDNPAEAVMLLGMSDQNLKLIEEAFHVQMITRGETIHLVGEEDARSQVTELLLALLQVVRKGINIDTRDVATAIEMTNKGTIEYFAELYDVEIARTTKCKPIRA